VAVGEMPDNDVKAAAIVFSFEAPSSSTSLEDEFFWDDFDNDF